MVISRLAYQAQADQLAAELEKARQSAAETREQAAAPRKRTTAKKDADYYLPPCNPDTAAFPLALKSRAWPGWLML